MSLSPSAGLQTSSHRRRCDSETTLIAPSTPVEGEGPASFDDDYRDPLYNFTRLENKPMTDERTTVMDDDAAAAAGMFHSDDLWARLAKR